MKETLYIASDHAGFKLKEYVVSQLKSTYDVIDCGPHEFIKHDDYPDYAKKVCEQVLKHRDRGILICDTGIGMSIAANRFPGIRAALVTSQFMAERCRLHNNANIICLGSDVLSEDKNLELITLWLATDFSGEQRHIRRLAEIEELR